MKLVIVGLSYVAVTFCSLANQVVLTIFTPQHYLNISFDYVVCESYGVEASKNCEQFIDITKVLPIYILTLITVIIQTIIPLVVLLINIDYTIFTSTTNKINSSLK